MSQPCKHKQHRLRTKIATPSRSPPHFCFRVRVGPSVEKNPCDFLDVVDRSEMERRPSPLQQPLPRQHSRSLWRSLPPNHQEKRKSSKFVRVNDFTRHTTLEYYTSITHLQRTSTTPPAQTTPSAPKDRTPLRLTPLPLSASRSCPPQRREAFSRLPQNETK